ncbi:MAG: RNA helicase [Oscillospiraceae bacterium]|jgi:ATP-dependent RNA helicase SUPV3L1/SUV3|nr:RNA helicase [Oscillospiraceae bacterium]
MIFSNREAFKKYNAGLDNPIFTVAQLEEAGLKPIGETTGETHTIKNKDHIFYTADQAVKIEGQEPKQPELPLIKEIDDMTAFITAAMGSEAPLSNLEDICKRTRKISTKCHKFKAVHPASDAALREELNEKILGLRHLAGEYVKASANIVNTKYGGDAKIARAGGKLLSTITVKQIKDELVRSMLPGHPKDEFPQTRLMKRNVIIHCGETNTGKTYSALQVLMNAKTGVYLAPLRLLALEIYQTLNNSGVLCDLLTGEEKLKVDGAKHISSTIEMLNLDYEYEVALIDEAQLIADPQRGSSWTKAILGVRAKELIICCSNNAVPLIKKLVEDCGDTYTIEEHEREIPLVFENGQYSFPDHVLPGDAIIAFSRRRVLEMADTLASRGIKTSVIYGALPPESRRIQIKRFTDGESSVIIATDAIGMGLNLPVKRIVFTQVEKFNGFERRLLTAGEVKQIAGRAGRKNIYDVGYVASCTSQWRIESRLKAGLPELQYAYYLPIEQYVLNLPLGTLRQRLKACMDSREIKYIYKGDLTEPLKLLTDIEPYDCLSMREQYRMIFVPFDANNGGLWAIWRSYVDLYARGLPIPEPELGVRFLDEWEYAYKRLDLYYSFCSAMGTEMDTDWVMERKREVSKTIDKLLLLSLREPETEHDDSFVDRVY